MQQPKELQNHDLSGSTYRWTLRCTTSGLFALSDFFTKNGLHLTDLPSDGCYKFYKKICQTDQSGQTEQPTLPLPNEGIISFVITLDCRNVEITSICS